MSTFVRLANDVDVYEVDGFLEKPFDLTKFFNMVEDILKGRKP